MKIITLNGSPRKGGNTARIVSLIEKRLRERASAAGVELEYEYIPLSGLAIAPCRGCRICFNKGETQCPQRDALLDLNGRLLEADGIIMASPVFVEDVSGTMKTFIDRMVFHCHRPGFAGKSAIVIVTSGSGSSRHPLRTMQYALMSWGFRMKGRKKFRMGALMDPVEAEKKYGGAAARLGDRLYASVTDSTSFSPAFSSLIAFKIQQKYWLRTSKEMDSYDYRYWKNKGWLEPGCNYYISHKSNLIKAGFARLAAGVVTVFLR